MENHLYHIRSPPLNDIFITHLLRTYYLLRETAFNGSYAIGAAVVTWLLSFIFITVEHCNNVFRICTLIVCEVYELRTNFF